MGCTLGIQPPFNTSTGYKYTLQRSLAVVLLGTVKPLSEEMLVSGHEKHVPWSFGANLPASGVFDRNKAFWSSTEMKHPQLAAGRLQS